MKPVCFLTMLIFFSISVSFAQSRETVPVAVPVEGGVWIYLGNRVPKNVRYQIERRKENTRAFEKIGEATAPASQAEMLSRQSVYQKVFNKIDPLSSDDISRLWKYLGSNNVMDTFYSRNLPMMHLLAGTAFFDDKADKNTNYIYRITLPATGGIGQYQKESNATASFKKPVFPQINFSAKRSGGDRLELTWALKDKKDMAHFNVYRSVFGKDEFKRLTQSEDKLQTGVYADKDSLKLMAVDSIGQQPVWYEYQVAPVSAYGAEGPMQGMTSGGNIADNYAPPITNFRTVNTQRNHEIKLMWRLNNKKYLNGITIMRSSNYDSGYRRIATVPVTDSSYTDILPQSGENYYYYLQLLSAGNIPFKTAKVFALYTNADTKPEPPNEIDATTVSNGITIYWKSEATYTNGFFVYRRKNNDEPFVQVSPVIPAGKPLYSFTDSSRQLQGGELYEYVVRTRNEDNQLSANSDTVSALAGKHKTLTSPMNARYRTNDGHITIIWDDMTRWDDNLAGYKILRRENNGAWINMNNDSLTVARNFYTDSLVNPGSSYSYAVMSYDFAGNQSEPSIINIPALTANLIPAPAGISVEQTGMSAYISWGQLAGDISAIKIYRSEPGQKAVLMGTVEDGSDFFTDKNLSKGKLYFYQLSVLNTQKKEGPLSEKVALRVR